MRSRRKVIEKSAWRYLPSRDGVSPSFLEAWSRCRVAGSRYVEGWRKPRPSEGAWYGSYIHEVIDAVAVQRISLGENDWIPQMKFVREVLHRTYDDLVAEQSFPSADTLQKLEDCLLLAEIVLPEYFLFWREEDSRRELLETERKLEVDFAGVRLKGRIDQSYKDLHGDVWVTDTKSRIRIVPQDLVSEMEQNFQIFFYGFCLLRIDGVKVRGFERNLVRRPGLRRKKGEPRLQFFQRVREDVQKRPEFYFQRIPRPLERGGAEIRDFKQHLRGMLREYLAWEKGERAHYADYLACKTSWGWCEHLDFCTRGGEKVNDNSGYERPKKRRQKCASEKSEEPGKEISLPSRPKGRNRRKSSRTIRSSATEEKRSGRRPSSRSSRRHSS